MAKGNLLLGFARGKLGDVVFYRQNGAQISRPRNTHPKNPQTALQLAQRSIMKTSAQAFSLLQAICNHSFQGQEGVTANQSRFNRLNVAYLRQQVAEELSSGDSTAISSSTKTNFADKSAVLAQVNPYQVSEGTIAPLSYDCDEDKIRLTTGTDGEDLPVSYADICAGLGLSRGDQLTFIGLSVDDTQSLGVFNQMKYARVILEPAGGDMSVDFLAAGGVVNDPNPRNEGSITLSERGSGNRSWLAVEFEGITSETDMANTFMAGAVIASRLSGSVWQRSSQRLALIPSTGAYAPSESQLVNTLGDAVMSYVLEANSTLYLNQAENF